MSAALWSLAHGGTSMDEFLHEYGYQGNRAADLYATVWREDPEPAAADPRHDGVDAGGRTVPRRPARRASPTASTPKRELLDALYGADRDAAERAIADARRFTVLREQVKVVSQRSLDVARAAARTLGRDLATQRRARRARRRVPPRGRRVRHRARARPAGAGRLPQGAGRRVRDLRPPGAVRRQPRPRSPLADDVHRRDPSPSRGSG